LLVPFLVATGCGDDEPTPPAAMGNNGVGNNGASNNGGGNNGVSNNGVSNNGVSNNGVSNNGVSNNGSLMCRGGAVRFESPASGATVGPREDLDLAVDGVQVDLRLSVTGVSDAILTVTDETAGESWGTSVEGTSVVIAGVTLREGAHRLTAVVDGVGCLVTAQATVQVAPGRACAVDGQCGQGELCEDGVCAACEATCASDADCGGGRCAQGCFCVAPYRYVMVEDLDPAASGRTPGADIDAIGLERSGRAPVYASEVLASSVPQTGNDFPDVNELLGPPDANCQVRGFVALGGLPASGFVVVGFEEGGQPAFIDNGDVITVYEVGRLLCPNSNYLDEPYAVSVSASTDLGVFVEIGQGGAGGNRIAVSGL